MDDISTKEFSRRDFLKLTTATVGSAALGLLAPKPVHPHGHENQNEKIENSVESVTSTAGQLGEFEKADGVYGEIFGKDAHIYRITADQVPSAGDPVKVNHYFSKDGVHAIDNNFFDAEGKIAAKGSRVLKTVMQTVTDLHAYALNDFGYRPVSGELEFFWGKTVFPVMTVAKNFIYRACEEIPVRYFYSTDTFIPDPDNMTTTEYSRLNWGTLHEAAHGAFSFRGVPLDVESEVLAEAYSYGVLLRKNLFPERLVAPRMMDMVANQCNIDPKGVNRYSLAYVFDYIAKAAEDHTGEKIGMDGVIKEIWKNAHMTCKADTNVDLEQDVLNPVLKKLTGQTWRESSILSLLATHPNSTIRLLTKNYQRQKSEAGSTERASWDKNHTFLVSETSAIDLSLKPERGAVVYEEIKINAADHYQIDYDTESTTVALLDKNGKPHIIQPGAIDAAAFSLEEDIRSLILTATRKIGADDKVASIQIKRV